jgi:2,5-diamino-6-(ribosylamino)-4(3H)-pyrimidinone 5'-phosphate reductase
LEAHRSLPDRKRLLTLQPPTNSQPFGIMKPRVIIYNATSLDGQTTGFQPDLGQFYGLASRWHEDASLAGCDTLLSFPAEIPPEVPSDLEEEAASSNEHRPLLVVPDSRGRLRSWHFLKKQPYWRDWVSLCTETTPPEHVEYLRARMVRVVTAGKQRVDYRAALEELNLQLGVKVVRVDSGGTLNSILLREGLADEVHLLVHPVLVGQPVRKVFFEDAGACVTLRLEGYERLENGALLLSYSIASPRAA